MKHLLFNEGASTFWIELRLWIAFKILPKQFANFFELVASKLEMEYEKLDSDKKDKITSLVIDFEFRE